MLNYQKVVILEFHAVLKVILHVSDSGLSILRIFPNLTSHDMSLFFHEISCLLFFVASQNSNLCSLFHIFQWFSYSFPHGFRRSTKTEFSLAIGIFRADFSGRNLRESPHKMWSKIFWRSPMEGALSYKIPTWYIMAI